MDTDNLFFSIVIPAHNEEKYIGETLDNIFSTTYPPGKFEIIVIENGSTDKTLEVLNTLHSPNLTVLSSPCKGVSRAKNTGIDTSSPDADWVIFLDADTLLKKDFLANFDQFLRSHKKGNYTVGTVSLRPHPDKKIARAWFTVHNFGHRISETSFAIKMVRRDILTHHRFDENLIIGEDVVIINEAKKYGDFFFFSTPDVYTSTRRFDQEGWVKVFLQWSIVGLLPKKIKTFFGYEVIR